MESKLTPTITIATSGTETAMTTVFTVRLLKNSRK